MNLNIRKLYGKSLTSNLHQNYEMMNKDVLRLAYTYFKVQVIIDTADSGAPHACCTTQNAISTELERRICCIQKTGCG